MKKKIAINGFGRIGRLTFRNLMQNDAVEVVAINDLTDPKTLAHLLKYDTAHGRYKGDVKVDGNTLIVDGHAILITAIKDPAALPWKEHAIDVVLECTGIFRDVAGMSKHIEAGAKRVLLSAPAKKGIKTVVLGVNDHELTSEDVLVSNASCTTNCLAPMAKVIQDNFGIVKGFMTTVHAFTSDQRIQDAPHDDLRRARAASQSIIPTSTGAATAVGLVLPELDGKLDGMAMRVPTITGSVTDLTVILEREVTVEEVNAAMKAAAEGPMKGILEYCTDPIVSADIVGSTYSNIFDADLTSANGNMLKVIGWYDNEAGYSARLADMCLKMAQL